MPNPKLTIKPNGKVDLWDLGPPKDDPHRKAWEAQTGPHQVDLWAVDARHALEVEPERYVIKLPSGTKPGPAQKLIEESRAASMQLAEKPDPHFGAGASP